MVWVVTGFMGNSSATASRTGFTKVASAPGGVDPSATWCRPSIRASAFRCQIDHRSETNPTQPDRDGVDGVQALDGVHGDLRSEAKCTGAALLGKAEWPRPRGRSFEQREFGRPRRDVTRRPVASAHRDLLQPRLTPPSSDGAKLGRLVFRKPYAKLPPSSLARPRRVPQRAHPARARIPLLSRDTR